MRASDVVGARAAGEQAIVADAVEALRQDVDQKSADELAGGERHDLLAVATIGAIVLPSEGDIGVVPGDQTAVGDGDTVGIARQISQHGLWPAERALGIDDPLSSAQRRQIGRERLRIGESGVIAEEPQMAGLVDRKQLLQEQPSEQAREHADRQEEAGPARYPALAVKRDAAARHDHVDVRMMGQRRTPGMENRGDADASAEVLGLGGDRGQGLGRGLEQQVVDHGLVLVGDIGDGRRQCEHDVIVRHRLGPRQSRPSDGGPCDGGGGRTACGGNEVDEAPCACAHDPTTARYGPEKGARGAGMGRAKNSALAHWLIDWICTLGLI
jgi:hypothetical protein